MEESSIRFCQAENSLKHCYFFTLKQVSNMPYNFPFPPQLTTLPPTPPLHKNERLLKISSTFFDLVDYFSRSCNGKSQRSNSVRHPVKQTAKNAPKISISGDEDLVRKKRLFCRACIKTSRLQNHLEINPFSTRLTTHEVVLGNREIWNRSCGLASSLGGTKCQLVTNAVF